MIDYSRVSRQPLALRSFLFEACDCKETTHDTRQRQISKEEKLKCIVQLLRGK